MSSSVISSSRSVSIWWSSRSACSGATAEKGALIAGAGGEERGEQGRGPLPVRRPGLSPPLPVRQPGQSPPLRDRHAASRTQSVTTRPQPGRQPQVYPLCTWGDAPRFSDWQRLFFCLPGEFVAGPVPSVCLWWRFALVIPKREIQGEAPRHELASCPSPRPTCTACSLTPTCSARAGRTWTVASRGAPIQQLDGSSGHGNPLASCCGPTRLALGT